MVALPFYYLTLRAKKPGNPAYPEHLITLGDHVRQRRLDLGMHQKNVAALVNATTSTVTNWEKGRTYPNLKFIPRVHEFLGYIPFESKQRPLLDKSGSLGVVMAQV
jgi:transcriptional regulator with XRE-family HTH domain